jgi:GNAT superfamily N-acetyltransferase
MLIIRDYIECDAPEVGRLIADTYREFNLSFAPSEDQSLMLGPFRDAWSEDPRLQAAIAQILESPIFFVAETNKKTNNQIVGVLRGREERLASLFVHKNHHHQGIGRQLVQRFEQEMRAQHITTIRVAATLYAVPFYTKLGYKKSTGLRQSWSFDGYGLPVQPMKKVLKAS